MMQTNSWRLSAQSRAIAGLVLGLGAAGHAAAQSEAPAAPAAASQAESQDKVTTLDKVVVTAQKRLQFASKTPLALSVVGGDDLKELGAVRIDNLSDLMPNVEIADGDSAHGMTIRIRGISSSDFTDSGDPSAAFNLDGIYIARPQAQGLSFFDLERVEVLRGPQGTLYGRNATAGAINVISNKPKFQFSGAAGLTLGNLNTLRYEAMVNAPVNDMLALRLAVAGNRRDGYLDSTNGTPAHNDANDDALRLHGLLKISPATSLLVTLDAAHIGGVGSGMVPLERFYSGDKKQQRLFNASVPSAFDDDTHGIAAEFKHDFGPVELTYQFGHRELKRHEDTAHGELPFPLLFRGQSEQDSHELRLASNGTSALEWVAGLYSFKERSLTDYTIANLLGPGVGLHWLVDPTKASTKAAFAQASYALTEALRLTGGLRRTADAKSQSGTMYVGDVPGPYGAAARYNKTNWKVGADYTVSRALMLYASVSTGYKAGGFNQGSDDPSKPNYNPNLIYNPENLRATEVGAKGRALDGRLQFNAALFDYDYRDLQLSAGMPPTSSSGAFATVNAAKASVRGFDLDGKFAITPDDILTYSVGLLKSKYIGYTAGPVGSQQDWSGRALDNSPNGTVALGYQHNWPLAGGANLSARVSVRHSGSYVVSDYNAPRQYTQGAFTKADLSLQWESANGNYSVQGFVKNATDKTVIKAYSGLGTGGLIIGEPRLLGVRLAARF
jgi:iron complex outermembrane receptor protein